MSKNLDKIFNKECNEHEELLLCSQMAAKELLSVTAATSSANAKTIQKWVVDILDCMRGMLVFLQTTVVKSSDTWVGGLTNIPDVFLPMYQALLGLWTVRNVPVASGAIDLVLLQEIHDNLQQEAVHPLLRCLSTCVAKEYLCDQTTYSLGWFGGTAEGFDPLFLVEL